MLLYSACEQHLWTLGGYVEEWYIHRKTVSIMVFCECTMVHYRSQPLTTHPSGSLGDINVSCAQKAVQLQMECAAPLHIHPMSSYVMTPCDQFYQAFPCVNTAKDKRWVKMAWV